MAMQLTAFSTVQDLRKCSNDVLTAGIDAVGKEVILAYILELRNSLNQAVAVLGPYSTPFAPTAPFAPSAAITEAPSYAISTPMQEAPFPGLTSEMQQVSVTRGSVGIDESLENNVWEQKVAKCRSAKSTDGDVYIYFENCISNGLAIDLIKIDHNGNEHVIKENVQPNTKETIHALQKHAYIARESRSRKLLVFHYESLGSHDVSVIFEPLNYGLTYSTCNFPTFVIFSPYKDGIELDEYLKDRNPLMLFPPFYEEEEMPAILAKSVDQEIKRKVKFLNCTGESVDLIWKDHEGKEICEEDMKPAENHKVKTFYTHRFIARDKATRELRSFCYQDKRATVFEANDLGIEQGVDGSPFVEIRNLFDCTKYQGN